MPSSLLTLTLSLLAILPFTTAIPTISQKGQKFFTADGAQWFIKGVAYQLNPLDLGTDVAQCQADAALMQQLGANAIRVYHVDPSLDHDACMGAFEQRGIYVFVDLDTFTSTVTQGVNQWTPAMFGAFRFVMDAFQKYDNVAGFFIGNEVVNSVGPNTQAMAYVKAATADLKAYRNAMGYREIPIGYSHADVAGLRPVLQNYLACGDPAQAIDFFGLNAYEWCGASSYMQSGYETLYQQTVNYPVPIFMSETGCNQPEPRLFTDQGAIFGPMADVWSGSIIYEWIQESNQYGLVVYGSCDVNSVDNAGCTFRSGTPTPVVPDFQNLKNEWAGLNPTGVQASAYTPNLPAMACPAYSDDWQVDPNAPLPTLGLGVAIPTASALALANDGLSPPFSVPAAAALPVAASSATAAAPAVSSTPAPPTSATSAASVVPVAAPASSASVVATQPAVSSASASASAGPTPVPVGFFSDASSAATSPASSPAASTPPASSSATASPSPSQLSGISGVSAIAPASGISSSSSGSVPSTASSSTPASSSALASESMSTTTTKAATSTSAPVSAAATSASSAVSSAAAAATSAVKASEGDRIRITAAWMTLVAAAMAGLVIGV